MRDSPIISIISGFAGGFTYQVTVSILYILGLSKTTPFQLGAYILIKPGLDISSFPAQALGSVQHFSNSILLGLIVVLLLRQFGTDYIWIKGLAYGGVVYFLLYGVIARALIPPEILQPDLATSAVYLLGNLIYGIVTTVVASICINKFNKPSIK